MTEHRLFDPAAPPECVTADWYADRDYAPHLDEEGHRQRIWLAARQVEGAIDRGVTSIVDVGAGDGGLLSLLPLAVPSVGYDLMPSNVAGARKRGVNVLYRDVLADPITAWPDLTIATEFLEHLVDPHAFVRSIGSRFLVASSPYTETAEHHYEHHLWAWDLDGYRKLLTDAGWRVHLQETAWISQCLLAERP